MVRPERFELPTYCSGGNRSIHLSYGRTPTTFSLHGRGEKLQLEHFVGEGQDRRAPSIRTVAAISKGSSATAEDRTPFAVEKIITPFELADSYQRPRPPPPPPPPRPPRSPPRSPPRPPRSRPPPPARSVLGRASFTLSVRPPTCEPFNAVIAFSPSSLLAISTNPKPRDRPVSRSVIMLTRSTWPKGSKSCRNSSSAVLKLRLPTKIFFTLLPLHCSVGVRAQFGGLQGGRTLLKIETGAGEQSNAAEV